jgi:catechol 2,3-dioxygenase-like lactoylglutathione lyase family enzyme
MAKIKHIALSTLDPEATARFYVDVFGLKQVARSVHCSPAGRLTAGRPGGAASRGAPGSCVVPPEEPAPVVCRATAASP